MASINAVKRKTEHINIYENLYFKQQKWVNKKCNIYYIAFSKTNIGDRKKTEIKNESKNRQQYFVQLKLSC